MSDGLVRSQFSFFPLIWPVDKQTWEDATNRQSHQSHFISQNIIANTVASLVSPPSAAVLSVRRDVNAALIAASAAQTVAKGLSHQLYKQMRLLRYQV